jgi:hypothetical protein
MRRPPFKEAIELVPDTAWKTIAGMSFVYGFAAAGLVEMPPPHAHRAQGDSSHNAEHIMPQPGIEHSDAEHSLRLTSTAGKITAVQIKIHRLPEN